MPNNSSTMARELRAIRFSFNRLAKSFARIAPILTVAPAGARMTAPAPEVQERPRRKPALTAAQLKSLKLQGKYMGTMRGLPAAKRAIVKKVRVAKGIHAAIAEARRLAG